jgi:parallel beta-helix repeat protein
MRKQSLYSLALIASLLGMFSLSVGIQNVHAPYLIITIMADGSISPPSANITTADKVTYTFTTDMNASIIVQRSNIVIDGNGWTLGGNDYAIIHGLNLTHVSNVTISNVNVMGFGYGIYLQSSTLNNILDSNVTFNEGNIYLGDSYNNTIIGNTITNGAEAIQLSSSFNNTIFSNSLSYNYYGVWSRFNSDENVISGNNITENNNGIHLDSSSSNTISRNNVTANNYHGIYLSESSNNTISENDITYNSFVPGGSGIMLDFSSNNVLSGNSIIANNWWGINPSSSNNNTIFGNNIRNNKVGINSDSSDFNIVSANNIIDNGELGIYFESSSNNTLHHNNLINNANQVVVDLDYANNWDDGIEGNYWSNYTGVDLNYDGIGDIWHEISENNTDHYPLMGPFHSFNTTLGRPVNVISNSTIEGFQYFESNSTIKMYVSNMTADQTQGFCRISIPYEVMSEPFSVTVDGANPTYWNYTLYDNGTHSWIYFEYEHSTSEVIIIPEFPFFGILPAFMILMSLATLAYRRKHISEA